MANRRAITTYGITDAVTIIPPVITLVATINNVTLPCVSLPQHTNTLTITSTDPILLSYSTGPHEHNLSVVGSATLPIAMICPPIRVRANIFASLFEAEERFARDTIIAIGHNTKDITILNNNYETELQVKITLGSSDSLLHVCSDTLIGEDSANQHETTICDDLCTLLDANDYIFMVPPIEYDDLILFNECDFDTSGGADVICEDLITFYDEYTTTYTMGLFDSGALSDDKVLAPDKLSQVSDTIRIYDMSGAGIHKELNDLINFYDTAKQQAEDSRLDTLTIDDTAKKQALFEAETPDLITTNDYFDRDVLTTITEVILSLSDDYKRDEFSTETDTIDGSDALDYYLDQGAVGSDTLNGADSLFAWEMELTRSYYDTIVMSDSKVIEGIFEKEYSDSATANDGYGKHIEDERFDSITFSDSYEYIVNVSDLITFNDDSVSDIVITHIKTDSISASDDIFVENLLISFTDSATLSDSAKQNQNWYIDEGFIFYDAFKRDQYDSREDTINAGDSLEYIVFLEDSITFNPDSYEIAYVKGYVDSITMTDALIIGGTFDREFSDVVMMLTDSFFKGIVQNLEDTLTLSDEFSQVVNLYDIISISDSHIWEITKGLSDRLTFSDSKTYGGEFERSYNDSILALDVIGIGTVQPLSDTLTMSDILTRDIVLTDLLTSSDEIIVNLLKVFSETLRSTDTAEVSGSLTVSYEDRLYIEDDAQRDRLISKDDSVTLIDVVDRDFECSEVLTLIDSHYVTRTKIISDSITARDTLIFGGEFYKNYYDYTSLSDVVKKQAYNQSTDIVTISDTFENLVEYFDGVLLLDTWRLDRTRIVSDSVSLTDYKTVGGYLTVTYYDTLHSSDQFSRDVYRQYTDIATLNDVFERTIVCSDNLTLWDTTTPSYTHMVVYQDTIVETDYLDFGGEFYFEHTDTFTMFDFYGENGNIVESEAILIRSGAKRDIISDLTTEVTLLDVVKQQQEVERPDSITISDSFTYLHIRWGSLLSDNFDWLPSITDNPIFDDSYEVAKPITTSQFVFEDTFEWFAPYVRPVVWDTTPLFLDAFELPYHQWTPLLDDSFEYGITMYWQYYTDDAFEWFDPYRIVTIEQLSISESFEWETVVTYTPIYDTSFEVSPPVWVKCYEYEDPTNPCVWVSSTFYSDDLEVSYSASWNKSFTDRFEVSNPVVWNDTSIFDNSFETSYTATWIFSYEDDFSRVVVDWIFEYLDDFEPLPHINLNIAVVMEKTNKRLDTEVYPAYCNLNKYSFDPEDPKQFYTLQNLIIANRGYKWNLYIKAIKQQIKTERTTIISSYGEVILVLSAIIDCWKEVAPVICTTHIRCTSYLFKYYTTVVSAGLTTVEPSLVTSIYAPQKELTPRIRQNISVGREAYRAFRVSIGTAGNFALHKWGTNIYSRKLMIPKVFKGINIYASYLTETASKIHKRTDIAGSYGNKISFFTEISAPFRNKVYTLRTNIRTAYPMTKYYTANITTAYWDANLFNTVVWCRDGEKAIHYHTNIKTRVERTIIMTRPLIVVSYGNADRIMRTYIGGPFDLPFYKENTSKLRTYIKTITEAFDQVSPFNNRRRTNIVVGDVGIPFIKTKYFRCGIYATKATSKSVKTNIVSDFIPVVEKIIGTHLWVLRCQMCMKHNIQAAYRKYYIANVWAAYGMGSNGYVDKRYHMNLRGLRVPQGYYFTQIHAFAHEKLKTGFYSNISVWRGPTYTVKQKIWNTVIPNTKLIIRKNYKTLISVGLWTSKIQTVSNIFCQKGEYKYLLNHINASIAERVTTQNHEISATFSSYVMQNNNVWADNADHARKIYGGRTFYNMNIFAMKQIAVPGYGLNIKTLGEAIWVYSCGVHQTTPPMVTYMEASKTIFAPIMYTTFDLVSIVSRFTIIESYRILSDIGEGFEVEPVYRYEYTLFNWENFNQWLTFRYRFDYKFTEDFLSFINPTKLYYRKIVENLNTLLLKSKWYLQPRVEEFEWEKAKEYVGHSYNMDDEFMIWDYLTYSGENRLDIEIYDGVVANDYLKLLEAWIKDGITLRDYYLTDLVTLKEQILKIRDSKTHELVRWVHLYEKLVLRDDYQSSPSIIMQFFDLTKAYTTTVEPVRVDFVDIRCVYPESIFTLSMDITEVYMSLPEIVISSMDQVKEGIVVEHDLIKENYTLTKGYTTIDPANIVKSEFTLDNVYDAIEPPVIDHTFDITTVYDTTYFITSYDYNLFVPYVTLVDTFVLDFDLTKSTGVEPLTTIGFDSDVFTSIYTHADSIIAVNFTTFEQGDILTCFDFIKARDYLL